MKTTKRGLSVGIAVAAIAVALFLVLAVAVPAFSASAPLTRFAPTQTPTLRSRDVIPLKPIADLTSLTATMELDVNGFINGERARGGLTAVMATNDQGGTKVTLTGDLLGELAAQVGGSLAGLFAPSSVDIYKMPRGNYAVVNGLFPVCVQLADSRTTAALEEQSPQDLLSMLTSSDVARGKLVGREAIDGVAVNHYVLDGDDFLASARKSNDPELRALGEALWSAEDADLFVDAKSGYPVAFRGSYSGSYEPFEGDLDVQIELTGVNANAPVNLPKSCNRPISP